MMSKNIFLLVFSFAFIIFSSGSLFAQEKKIDKKDLPKAVLSTFQKSYPNATIKVTSVEKEHGKTYYEIESLEGTQGRDLLYTKEGKVAEIEETLASNDVPDFVKSSVMKKYPNCEINRAEKVTSGERIRFELAVKNGMQKYEVILDSRGKIKKIENMRKENEGKEAQENEREDND